MENQFVAISEQEDKKIDTKKSLESINTVGMFRHWLYGEFIIKLDNIQLTQEAAQLLVDHKLNIFDLFCLFRDLKYDYELGQYYHNIDAAKRAKEIKDYKKL